MGRIVPQPDSCGAANSSLFDHLVGASEQRRLGHNSFFDAKVIPSVAYTDPQVAWVGLTENEAKARGIKYRKGFPRAASGRSLSLGRDEGITKVLLDENTHGIIRPRDRRAQRR
jgi:pyruvate/2-oxoglutarate dehydrogenase complex dihydrolipoamide dehydrogenase (E3) component